jgi:DNA polymerase-3 subunit gamma/tau
VGRDTIMGLLREILDSEGVKCSDPALAAIARAADGGVRDAESILDQLVSYCGNEITFQDVFDVLGLVDWRVLHTMCDAIHAKDISKLLEIVEDVVVSGKDLGQFVDEILRYFRNLIVCRAGASTDLLALPEDEVAEMQRQAQRFTLTELIRLVEQFAQLAQGFDTQLAQRTALETLLIRISKRAVEVSVDSVLEKIALLQEGGNSGTAAVQPRDNAAAPKPAAEAPAPAREAPVQKKTVDESRSSDVGPADNGKKVPKPRLARKRVSSPEAQRAVANDPQVAAVLEVFRGEIVQVTPPADADDAGEPDRHLDS